MKLKGELDSHCEFTGTHSMICSAFVIHFSFFSPYFPIMSQGTFELFFFLFPWNNWCVFSSDYFDQQDCSIWDIYQTT